MQKNLMKVFTFITKFVKYNRMVKRLLSIIGNCNFKHFLLLFVLFFFSHQTAKADHVMGADMSYVCLGSGKYKLIIKFYREIGRAHV